MKVKMLLKAKLVKLVSFTALSKMLGDFIFEVLKSFLF